MINLTDFKPVQTKGRGIVESSYVVFESKGKGNTIASIKLNRKDNGEVTRYFGNTVRVYAGRAGEFVLTRGDRRVAQTGESGGKIQIGVLTDDLRKAFPTASRIYLKGEWDTDESGNTVFHLVPTGKIEEDTRIVMGRRLEDKR